MSYCDKKEQCEQSEKEVRFCMNCKQFNKRHIKFIKVDDFNRPVFKVMERGYYISDVSNLFPKDTQEPEIKKFYKDKEINQCLTYHGSRVDCEPMGYELSNFNFVFV